MLLLHRPMRCRMCNDRYYVYRKLSRSGSTGDRQRAASFGIFPRLWMHYAFFVVIIGGIGLAMYPQRVIRMQQRLAKMFQQQETVDAAQ
ncbi:hypothetical protein [Planctomicrobium piriforme]|nr:hypothetical protein [Planctomicrobium piriforme]